MRRSAGTSRSALPILLLVPAACLVVACGGGKRNASSGQKVATTATASSTTPSFDYCTLLTKEEVEAAVGWKVLTAEVVGRGDYGSCTYKGRKDPMILPPENAEAGVTSCVTNFPCYQDLPDFHSSEEMAQYRRQRYKDYKGAFEGVQANIAPLDGFGVPAIDHELAGMRSIEMQIGHKRVAYVSIWGDAGPARELAKKVLARAR